MGLSFNTNMFIYFCQCPLTVNAPIYKCVRPLIDYNIDIDSWDGWDCILSVIGTVYNVDASFPSVVSMLLFYQYSLMPFLPSVDRFLYI